MREIIEDFIRTGKTTAEIQSEIIEFPDDVTTEYLEKIGFEEIKAIRLKWKLRQNNRIREQEIKAEKGRRKLLETGGYRFSPNANPDFVLLDTCALLDENGLKVISRSSRVIVIESILQEIDKLYQEKKRKRKKNLNDCKDIEILETYKRKIFMQAKFKEKLDRPKEGMNYCDDKILYYLYNLPPEQRPTLLTADYDFSSRAKAYGFEYIFIIKSPNKSKCNTSKKSEVVETVKVIEETESEKKLELQSIKKEEKESPKTVKKIINEIKFELTGDQITVTGLNKQVKTYFVKENKVTLAKQSNVSKMGSNDFIIMIFKQKCNREIRIRKISVVNNQINVDEEIIKFVNEIYKIEMPEEIKETARELLLD